MTAEGTKDVIRNLNGRITNKIMVNNKKKKTKKTKIHTMIHNTPNRKLKLEQDRSHFYFDHCIVCSSLITA